MELIDKTTIQPLVTIMLLVTKESISVRQSIESILEQTYQNIEVLLVDSVQNGQVTEDLLQVTKQYTHMHYIENKSEENEIELYNKGISHATGEYIILLQAGDVMVANRVEKQVAYLIEHTDCVMVCSDMEGIKVGDGTVYNSYTRHYKIKFYKEEQTTHLIQGNFVIGNTLCFRKTLMDTAFPIPNTLGYVDWWLAVVGSMQGNIAYIDEPLVVHRIQVEELMGRKSFIRHRVEIAKMNADYYEAIIQYCRQYKQHYLAIIQPMTLRDKLISEYSIKKRWLYYYSEATYRCRRKIRFKEKIKIWAYLWLGPYLLIVRK